MALDRNIRWLSADKMPTRAALAGVLADYFGEAGEVTWDSDRWGVKLHGPCSSALRRQNAGPRLFEGEPRERWIEVWPSTELSCVDVMTRMSDEYTDALAVGLVGVIARWWQGTIERDDGVLRLPKGCRGSRYTFTIPRPRYDDDAAEVHVERVRGTGPDGKPIDRWAIRDGSCCWTKKRIGFVCESQPSNRTDAWLRSARWESKAEALTEAADHAVPWVKDISQ